ncbi:hypothetical protein Desor_3878 [Desulfosporosinus orientis DSM 765]|uniref:Transposase IS66 central domain-containing protein n=1 Tax=Desulfosporosinus orientis (strain ATCC 19365 / DSM 765 / NCIMB 8382 / VKM B-1628 / Singapore I) TaxID=768706 RepID=G7WBT0_DESOD|nr:transposase [Desulfosporosinus orientis]AET69327.1 hypothetical protein Desor_3878 [Desulfosporosinus orientis DSM 765]
MEEAVRSVADILSQAWAETTRTKQENLRKALNYTLNHKKYFTNFLLEGSIPLSNNLSEIAVKPVAITRKNSLFSDSVEGAKASAIRMTIIVILFNYYRLNV